jgi:predicted GNAT superfamily acetyltransferase
MVQIQLTHESLPSTYTGGMDYIIKDLFAATDMVGLEAVQQSAWGYDDRDLTPGSLFTVHAHMGGIVCAAFASSDLQTPVGFAYSFPARYKNKLVQHSHMLALHQNHRASGLAARLKLHQRSRALELGYDLMTWTFDPLLTKNARLNLGKLGTRAVSYHPDWYALRGGIYAGLPADRFFVEWDLSTPSVERQKTPANGKPVLEAVGVQAGLPVLKASETVLLIQSPRDIDGLKQSDLAAAATWREAHRVVFGHYLGRGYVVTDLHDDGEKTFYRLEQA